jgi:methyltransferase-like protein 6
VIFRDYAELDTAQLRFHQQSEPKLIEENLYLRQDGTLSYFFNEDYLRSLFESEGFECTEIGCVRRTIVNRKQEISMQRKWIQAKFRLLQ